MSDDPAIVDGAVTSDEPAIVDGRHRRRGRNRDAVVDAMLGLFRDGVLQPSAAEIAERSGLSERSLFRYFDDMDDLGRLAITRQLREVSPLLAIDVAADAPLEVRAHALATQRVTLFDQVAAVATVTRLRAPFIAVVREQLDRGREFLRGQVRATFAVELGAMTGAIAERSLAVLDVLTSFESHQLLRIDQGLAAERTIDVLTESIGLLLGAQVANS